MPEWTNSQFKWCHSLWWSQFWNLRQRRWWHQW